MKTTIIRNVRNKFKELNFDDIHMETFTSIEEFRNYVGSRYSHGYKSTSGGNRRWYGTDSYSEADELLRTGWTDKAISLNVDLKKMKSNKTRLKSFYDVAGFQVSVPRYLQGVPNNMMNQRRVTKKQKIITLNKQIGYQGAVSAQKIEEESLKVLKLVNDLEASGYRVNLNIVKVTQLGYGYGGKCVAFKIPLKKASERLNLSKVAYPMINSSMQRRHGFKWMETTDLLIGHTNRGNYGSSLHFNELVIIDKEIYLPNFMDEELVRTQMATDLQI